MGIQGSNNLTSLKQLITKKSLLQGCKTVGSLNSHNNYRCFPFPLHIYLRKIQTLIWAWVPKKSSCFALSFSDQGFSMPGQVPITLTWSKLSLLCFVVNIPFRRHGEQCSWFSLGIIIAATCCIISCTWFNWPNTEILLRQHAPLFAGPPAFGIHYFIQ